MRVKEVLQIIDKLQAVLEYYQEYTVEEMLKDIYSRCCVERGETAAPVVENESISSAGSIKIKEPETTEVVPATEDLLLFDENDLPPPELAIRILRDIPEENLDFILRRYTNKDLYTMVKLLNIKGHSKSNKNILVAALVEWAKGSLGMVPQEAVEQALPNRKPAQSATVVGGKGMHNESRRKPALQEAAGLIPEMGKEEAIGFLEGFTRSELLEIANLLNLSVSRIATKNNMILMIVNHFSYIKLHQQMSERRR